MKLEKPYTLSTEIGDILENADGERFIVTGVGPDRITAVATVDITDRDGWEIVSRVHDRRSCDG